MSVTESCSWVKCNVLPMLYRFWCLPDLSYSHCWSIPLLWLVLYCMKWHFSSPLQSSLSTTEPRFMRPHSLQSLEFTTGTVGMLQLNESYIFTADVMWIVLHVSTCFSLEGGKFTGSSITEFIQQNWTGGLVTAMAILISTCAVYSCIRGNVITRERKTRERGKGAWRTRKTKEGNKE